VAASAEDVVNYLSEFGYAADDAQSWDELPQDEVPEGLGRSGPWLGLGIAEHGESGGHTWYQVECSLALPDGSRTVQWQVGRRLQHLRELWYEPVKAELGEHYRHHFGDAPFAQRGGRRGTSARLHEWCCRFAACANAGQFSPARIASTLRLLEAPSASAVKDDWGCSSVGSTRDGLTPTGDLSPTGESSEEYESDFESDSDGSCAD
jgi:hypothetical protein